LSSVHRLRLLPVPAAGGYNHSIPSIHPEAAMRTIRCPTCQRPLSLPEHAELGTVQCPLCQATFDTPSPELGEMSPRAIPLAAKPDALSPGVLPFGVTAEPPAPMPEEDGVHPSADTETGLGSWFTLALSVCLVASVLLGLIVMWLDVPVWVQVVEGGLVVTVVFMGALAHFTEAWGGQGHDNEQGR
jgi:LSD1 subclass zinc finger protein